jgi:hypothetical protein
MADNPAVQPPPSSHQPQPAGVSLGSAFLTSDRILLRRLIDYAGLFPPARLDMPDAVRAYREARVGSHQWVLGRFLCPASRLEELAAVLTSTMTPPETPWEVGVILDGPAAPSAAAAQAFNSAMAPAAEITVVELVAAFEAADGRSVDGAAEVIRPHLLAATSISPRVATYVEVPRTEAWREGFPSAVGAISSLGWQLHREVGAKLRCGGLGVDLFPSSAQVVGFIVACIEAGVRFKATAGLHRPIRHFDPELGGHRHGFLNLLAATALAATDADESTLEAVIDEEDPGSFSIGSAGLRWRDLAAGTSVLERTRSEAFVAYGSCSFDEPIADLVQLQIVAAAP